MESDASWGDLLKSLKQNDWNAAIGGVNKLIKSEPENHSYHLKKGDIYQKSGNIPEAVNSYRMAAWYLREKGFIKKALAVYNLILRLDPDSQEATDASTKLMMEVMELESGGGGKEETLEAEAAKTEEAGEPASREPADLRFPFPLTDAEIKGVIGKAERKSFPDSQKVIIEGDTGDSIYIIKKGNAAVVMHLFGREINLATLSEGDFFGEVAFLTGRTRTATIVARGDLEVYEINRKLLEEIIEKKPEIMAYIHEIYLKRVKDTFQKVKA